MVEAPPLKGLPEQSARKVTVGNFALRPVGRGCRVSIRENVHGNPQRRRPVRLTGSNTAFGRHESFPLRFGWITKGLSALENNSKIFTSEDATIELGVGKNMVNVHNVLVCFHRLFPPGSRNTNATGVHKHCFSRRGNGTLCAAEEVCDF
ncbi:MAG: DUF4007 family protein [Gammaproteobacteria bacterium]|nr:DUF4007 family protein [Gammaproteobacteria bacterium]MYE50683.1 DUF4007 family protein [Gammaproteobacteria bacterium]